MASLSDLKFRELVLGLRDKHNIHTLVETGTHHGATARWAAEHFPRVVTMEKDNTLVAKLLTQQLAGGLPNNIKILHGDSRNLIKSVVETLDGCAVFWLDAHAIHASHGDDCPLMDELEVVLRSPHQHVVLIDDLHCFLGNFRDRAVWPLFDQIEECARDHLYNTWTAKDTIVMSHRNSGDDDDVRRWFVDVPSIAEPPRTPAPRIRASGTAVQTPKTYTEILDTDYGKMLVCKNDTWQYSALRDSRRSLNHDDVNMLIEVVLRHCPDNPVFFDIGANFGCYAFALRPYCRKVFAFEAQRILYNMLCGSIALNSWENVYAYHAAVGLEAQVIDIPQFDYWSPCSFGSIEFGAKQQETLHQQRQFDPEKRDLVPVVTLDGFGIERMDLIKIDVEGMEQHVLQGAEETIRRCRPIMLVEYIKAHPRVLREQIEALGYEVQYRAGDLLCFPTSAGQG